MREQPSDRSLAAQIAAHSKWAQCSDPTAATNAARTAFNQRFEAQVDPDGTLPIEIRSRMADHARKAYFKSLALKSAKARRKAKQLTAQAEAAEAELAGGDHAA